MARKLAVLSLLAWACGTSSAQDGGKIGWVGKGKDDVKAIMADAKKNGKAMMLFFTSEG